MDPFDVVALVLGVAPFAAVWLTWRLLGSR